MTCMGVTSRLVCVCRVISCPAAAWYGLVSCLVMLILFLPSAPINILLLCYHLQPTRRHQSYTSNSFAAHCAITLWSGVWTIISALHFQYAAAPTSYCSVITSLYPPVSATVCCVLDCVDSPLCCIAAAICMIFGPTVKL